MRHLGFLILSLLQSAPVLAAPPAPLSTAARPAAAGHKAPAKKKKALAPAPMYPARTQVQTAIVVSQVRLSWGAERSRLRVRYRLAAPEGTCPKGLHFFVPLGLPGNPTAFAARWSAAGAEGTPLPFERAPLLQPWAHALAGPTNTAGVVVHLSPALLQSWCQGAEAKLEVEQEFPTPNPDQEALRTVVVPMRAGSFGPLGLEQIESLDASTEEHGPLLSEAHWCSGAERGALLRSNAQSSSPTADEAQLPALSTRRVQDDLCLSTLAHATAQLPNPGL